MLWCSVKHRAHVFSWNVSMRASTCRSAPRRHQRLAKCSVVLFCACQSKDCVSRVAGSVKTLKREKSRPTDVSPVTLCVLIPRTNPFIKRSCAVYWYLSSFQLLLWMSLVPLLRSCITVFPVNRWWVQWRPGVQIWQLQLWRKCRILSRLRSCDY
jgi:hypothetical protein